jgi:hypothetical protein
VLIPKSERITKAVEALWQYTLALDRGKLVRYTVIERLAGMRRRHGSWNHVITKLRVRLKDERGISLKCVRGVAYKLAEISEQIRDLPQSHTKKALRQYRKADDHLKSTPVEELSLREQVVVNQQLQANRLAEQQIRRSRRIGKALGEREDG